MKAELLFTSAQLKNVSGLRFPITCFDFNCSIARRLPHSPATE